MSVLEGSVAGDARIPEDLIGRPMDVKLRGDYFGKLRIAAENTEVDMFERPTATLPSSALLTWMPQTIGSGAGCLRGPIDGLVVGVLLSSNHKVPAGSCAGVREGPEAMRIIASEFVRDLNDALAGVTAKYNAAIGSLAEGASLGESVALTKADQARNLPGLKTRQQAIAALKLNITGKIDVQDAWAAQSREGCKVSLKVERPWDQEEADDVDSVLGATPPESVASNRGKKRNPRRSTSGSTSGNA